MNVVQNSPLIKPLHLAETGERLEGCIKLASLEWLVETTSNNEAELIYRLLFYKDGSGSCVVDLEIDADVTLQCQRCLQPLDMHVHKKTLLGVVSNTDTLQALDKNYEPLSLSDDETLSLSRLLEDELLLAISFSVLHPEEECPAKAYLDSVNAGVSLKPFASLAALKQNMR